MQSCNHRKGRHQKTKGDLALRHLAMAFRVFSTVLVYATALDSIHAFAPAHKVRVSHGVIRMVANAVPIQALPLVTDKNYDEGEQ